MACSPLARAYVAFEMLPSLSLHPSQAERWLPSEAARRHGAQLLHWHRHWSAVLRKECELGSVSELADPALPLAMLPAPAFERLLQFAGAVLAGQRLRQCIAHEALEAVRLRIGDEALAFARFQASAFHPGLPLDARAPFAELGEWTHALGEGALAKIFATADPAVGRRGLLRLPVNAPKVSRCLPLDANGALRLSRSLLLSIEPQWLSWFPDTH